MKKNHFTVSIVFLLMIYWQFMACKKVENFPDKNIAYEGTKIIGHKGSGHWPYGNLRENTLESCLFGFKNADGVEIDVQKSRTGTMWLFHDEFIDECDIHSRGRIPAYSDEEIALHIKCMNSPYYHLDKLESIFLHHVGYRLKKEIVLDIKSWLPTVYSNSVGYQYDIADEILRLIEKYQLEKYVMVESENALILNRIQKKNTNIRTYLTVFCDVKNGMRKAIKSNYTGISCNTDCEILNEELLQLAHLKGLRVMVWVPNTFELINHYINMQVDYIQTDNVI